MMPMLVTELPWRDPFDCFASLSDDPHLAFLDSATAEDPRAEISYLCTDPLAILRLDDKEGDPFAALGAWLGRHAPPRRPAAPLPFSGGAVGFLGYDLGAASAGVASCHPPISDFPAGWFGVYDTILGFEHRSQRLWFMGQERANATAAKRLAALLQRLDTPSRLGPVSRPDWQPEWNAAQYRGRVEKIREYIAAGDIFQANLTHRFQAQRSKNFSAAGLYAALRRNSAAPFSAYLSCGDSAIISASPESFLRLSADGKVETRPIKGTAPRGINPEDDARLGRSLCKSEKDRAENLMIVDLMRNDLGRVCATGSIEVTELCELERFARVQHLVSAIQGQLRSGLGAIDLLRATFPGGSITGAPKHRAMQIIDEIETARRGAYCGTIAWIGFDGAMGSSIIIRSIIAAKDRLLAQAGGGIVWDSDAQAEYDEMQLKAAPLLEAYDA